MESFVNDAKDRGGKVATGGSRHGNQGFFYQPTVVTDVPDDSKIMTEEPFGPVAPIVPFKTFDEVVERANSLQFGLAAYAFTTSDKNASAISDALQSGMVGVNSVAISTPETPFGGVKESGYGSEGGIEGLQAYMNIKFISQAQGSGNLKPEMAGLTSGHFTLEGRRDSAISPPVRAGRLPRPLRASPAFPCDWRRHSVWRLRSHSSPPRSPPWCLLRQCPSHRAGCWSRVPNGPPRAARPAYRARAACRSP